MVPSKQKGVTLQRDDKGFDAAVMSTSFNARDPGRRPDVVVQANDTGDVIAAINQAREHGLKVSICSGGHSWAQNHIREGGLLIDVSRVRSIEINAVKQTATIGPGCHSGVSALATTPLAPRLDLWWFERAQFLDRAMFQGSSAS